MTKAEKKIEELEITLAELKEEVKREQAPINIFKQKGVLYDVWDGDEIRSDALGLHSFLINGQVRTLNRSNKAGCTWEHHRLHFPQWVKIPDTMMTAPKIKGLFTFRLRREEGKPLDKNTEIRHCADKMPWDNPPSSPQRITEVLIMEDQSL